MLLTAICEDGFSVASIQNVALTPSPSTQALEADAQGHQALLNSLPTHYPEKLTEGLNYLLVVTTSGAGIEEVICCASERDDLMADANTLNALSAELHHSYAILKIVLFR